MIFRIFMTLLVGGAGVAMVLYTRQVGDFTGSNEWVEEHIGNGMTYSLIKILGVVAIFLAFLYFIGQFDWIFAQFGR